MIQSDLPIQGDYCASVRVDVHSAAEDIHLWDWVKRQLIYKFMSELFPEMIDDGQYHVMKFDYYKVYNPSPEQFFYSDQFVEFRLVCHHSIARTERIVIPELPKVSLAAIPENYVAKKICQFCGNEWHEDHRGGCSACGGWPKGADPQQWAAL